MVLDLADFNQISILSRGAINEYGQETILFSVLVMHLIHLLRQLAVFTRYCVRPRHSLIIEKGGWQQITEDKDRTQAESGTSWQLWLEKPAGSGS